MCRWCGGRAILRGFPLSSFEPLQIIPMGALNGILIINGSYLSYSHRQTTGHSLSGFNIKASCIITEKHLKIKLLYSFLIIKTSIPAHITVYGNTCTCTEYIMNVVVLFFLLSQRKNSFLVHVGRLGRFKHIHIHVHVFVMLCFHSW